jgi:moderate conductance mechanosensitive channel
MSGIINEVIQRISSISLEAIFIVGLKIALTIVAMYLIIKIGGHVIDKFVQRQKKSIFSFEEKKTNTLAAVMKSILRYAVYFFGIVEILSLVFNGISLTFAGIGGVAIGFGAQDILKDIINGFFVLIEDQFSVGEHVTIEDRSGIVISVELRITKIRDFNGDIYTIPNRFISKVTNHSRGPIRIMIDVEVPYEEDDDRVIEILNNACKQFKSENEEVLTEGPSVLGISAIKANIESIRVLARVKPMSQWDCEMRLRKKLKEALEDGEVKAVVPNLNIIKG